MVYRDDVIVDQEIAIATAGTKRASSGRAYRHALNGAHLRGFYEYEARALAQDPDVAWVEPNGVFSGSVVQADAPWGLDRIDQRQLPLSTTYTYDFDGTGVEIYVIDSGIRITHTDFGARASNDYDAVGDGQNGNDCNGHGTHVAGIAGGARWGVAKNALLHSVRVLNCANQGTTADIVEGVDFVTARALAEPGASLVANMSIQGNGSNAMDTAVANSITGGVFYAIAAGNFSNDACNTSPGRTSQAFTAAATTASDSRAAFSNFGRCLDIFAPDEEIRSVGIASNTASTFLSGTSMAAPHIAGTAALILSQFPSFTVDQVSAEIRVRAARNAVIDPGRDSPNVLVSILTAPVVPPSVDIVTISRAQWTAQKGELEIEGSVSDAQASLTASFGSTSAPVVNDRGRFKARLSGVAANPGTVTVRSGNGGSDTEVVAVR